MRMQRVAIILLVLGLIVGMEVMLMNHCTRQDTALPLATPEPAATPETAQAQITPEAVESTTPAAVPTTGGSTSPPMPAGGTGQTQTQATTPPAAAATRAPTQAPQPTQAPTQAPTAPPTDPPVTQTVTASNSFSSDTGVGLNLGVSWQAVDNGDGTTTISIVGTIYSYTVNVMALPISINFSGYSQSVTGNSINITSSTITSNRLFSTSMTVATGTSGTMTVSWSYNGTYQDTELGTITATDFVWTN